MVAAMKQIAALAGEAELTIEERNLLSVAYKNQVGITRYLTSSFMNIASYSMMMMMMMIRSVPAVPLGASSNPWRAVRPSRVTRRGLPSSRSTVLWLRRSSMR